MQLYIELINIFCSTGYGTVKCGNGIYSVTTINGIAMYGNGINSVTAGYGTYKYRTGIYSVTTGNGIVIY